MNPLIDLLRRLNWSPEFERRMRDRLVMGRFRYGTLGALGKPQYDRIKSMRAKLDAYDKTGNDELLVDVANICLCEFIEGVHPKKHFKTLHEDEGVGIPKIKE